MVSASSSSPYTLPNPTVNDVYTFNVSVSNVAGVNTRNSFPVQGIQSEYKNYVVRGVTKNIFHSSVQLLY